jgi:hypothetical protein
MAKETVVVSEVKTFTTYAVVVFPDLAQVVAEVNALLARGWQPVGGIQISAQGSNVYHYQAMAK